MLSGKIKITWAKQDYESLVYKKHENPARGATYVWKDEEQLTASNLENNVSHAYEIPDSIRQIAENFGLKKVSLAIHKYDPGQILPWHKDLYATYKKFNNVDENETVVRIIVFLHDAEPGHQLWIENEFCTGKIGSYFGWENDTMHMAANLGLVPRYNLQITGVK